MQGKSKFYERLIKLSKQSKKSINQIERELGYPRNALHNYKLTREISGTRLVELAQYFHCSPEYLLGMSQEKYENSLELLFKKLNENDKIKILKLSESWFLSQIVQRE